MTAAVTKRSAHKNDLLFAKAFSFVPLVCITQYYWKVLVRGQCSRLSPNSSLLMLSVDKILQMIVS